MSSVERNNRINGYRSYNMIEAEQWNQEKTSSEVQQDKGMHTI